jgi:DNA-binding IclR family transcriptional regulator
MNRRESYPGAQTVSRAVALLKAFTDAQPERSLAELARAVGLHRTTTYRLLRALESDGMVMRGASGDTYRLGPEAIALGARALRSNDLRSAGHAELETLARATGETATLEVLAEDQVVILDEVIGQHHLLGTAQFVGTRWPAHATSTGKVLLAHLSDADRKAILHAPLAKHTPHTMTTLAALRDELACVREQGYATAIHELELGFTAVGAPVRNHDGIVVAAISLGGPSVRLTPDRIPKIAAVIIAAAERISERLGFRQE